MYYNIYSNIFKSIRFYFINSLYFFLDFFIYKSGNYYCQYPVQFISAGQALSTFKMLLINHRKTFSSRSQIRRK